MVEYTSIYTKKTQYALVLDELALPLKSCTLASIELRTSYTNVNQIAATTKTIDIIVSSTDVTNVFQFFCLKVR